MVKFCFTINFVTLPFALYEIFYDYFSREEDRRGNGMSRILTFNFTPFDFLIHLCMFSDWTKLY